MKQKEIYWVDLEPTKGNEQRGIRPAVIVSGDTMNNFLGICIICPVSSKIKQYPSCVFVKKDKKNNLKKDLEIITFQIRAVAKERLQNKIGEINETQLQEVFKELSKVLSY